MTTLEELKLGFWKVHRHKELSYYLNIDHFLSTAPLLDWAPPKCKFCKSYPFDIHSSKSSDKETWCQLCTALNDYKVQFQMVQKPPLNSWFDNHSFRCKLLNKANLSVTCMLVIDPWLELDVLQLIFEALAGVAKTSVHLCFVILIAVDSMLGVVQLAGDEPELIYLTDDIQIKEMTNDYAHHITQERIQKIKKVVLAVRQEKSGQKTLNAIEKMIFRFIQYKKNQFNIFVCFARVPIYFQPHRTTSIYTIGFFFCQEKYQNSGLLLDLRLSFTQTHVIAGLESSTQAYYKIYELFENLRYFHKSTPVLRTNVLYSGALKNSPKGIISHRGQLIEISVSNQLPHILQLQLQYFDLYKKQWELLVINVEDKKPFRCQAIEKSVLATRTLHFIVQKYIKAYQEKKTKFQIIFCPQFIWNTIAEYSGHPSQMTNYIQGLLHQMNEYFKEQMKNGVKMYRPFQLMGKIDVVGIFWPFHFQQDGLLHYVEGYYCKQVQSENLELINQLLGKYYVPQHHEKNLDNYYRSCLWNKKFTELSLNAEEDL